MTLLVRLAYFEIKSILTIYIRREAVENDYRGNKVLRNVVKETILRIYAYKCSYIMLEIRRNRIFFSRITNKIKSL